MKTGKTELGISLRLALKKVQRRDRAAFADRDWKIREEAGDAIAAVLEAELACYDFTLKPVPMPNTHQGHAGTLVQEPPEAPSRPVQAGSEDEGVVATKRRE